MGYYGFGGPIEDHTCIPHYRPTVGVGEVGYNKMVDLFRLDKLGWFVKAIVVNLMHDKVP